MGKRRTRKHNKGARKTNRRRVAKRARKTRQKGARGRKTRSMKMRGGNPTLALVDTGFWRANEGNKYGQLLAKVTDLLNKGAEVNAVDEPVKFTPLHYAAMYKAGPDVVELLLEKGANVRAKSALHKTALHFAVEHQAGPDVVELLLEKGASPVGIDLSKVEDGVNSPVLKKLKATAKKKEQALVDKTVWRERSNNEENILTDIQKRLNEGAKVNAKDSDDMTPLHLAMVYKAAPEVVSLLLEKGADVQAVDNANRRTALHFAVWKQAGPEVVSSLLDKGANVNAVDRKNYTTLHYAAMCKAGPKVVKLLLDNGADVHAVFDEITQCTALQLAIQCKSFPEVVKLLLDNGADVHAVDNFSWTALHYAAIYKAVPEVVKLLLKQGADVNAVDFENNNALQLAIQHKSFPEVKHLLEFGVQNQD